MSQTGNSGNGDLIRAALTSSPILIAGFVSLVFAFTTIANPPKDQKFVPPTATQKTTVTQQPTQQPTQATTVTAVLLYAEFISNPEQASAKYINRTINIQGKVSNYGTNWVTLETSVGTSLIQCNLGTGSIFDAAINQTVGNTVSITGTCRGLTGQLINIDDIKSTGLPVK